MHTYTLIPHLIKALQDLKLTTVDAIIHCKPSFVEGSIGTSDLDSFIAEVQQQWPEHKLDDAGMREGWKVFVLAARLLAGQQPDPDIFDKLQIIGLSRAEPARGIPRGLFCKYPGQSCLITYELLNQADPAVKAVVAAEVVALVEDITCNGHGERDFTNAWCTGARLQNVNLRRAKFEGLQGTLSNLSNAELSEATLNDAYFGFSNLEGVRFQFSVLQNVGFSFSSLRHSDFTRADMKNCNLYQTILTGAIFFNSNLSNASIDGAKFALYKPPGRRSAAMQPAWRGQASAILQYTSASLLNEYVEEDDEDEDDSDCDDDDDDADDDESAVDESADALKLKTQNTADARRNL
ncbi:hypothetical protein AB1Y20_012970 [Prymnesium parvum]|uniref:Pentapeptide repeat-containing protein n=1 Tax=Prymnesium parvum TaxID=97485 RepID=A0AB34IJC7_PRYPA